MCASNMDQARLYLEQAIDDEAEAFRLEPSNHRETLAAYQSQLEQMNRTADAQ